MPFTRLYTDKDTVRYFFAECTGIRMDKEQDRVSPLEIH